MSEDLYTFIVGTVPFVVIATLLLVSMVRRRND
jgi:hypothetical protein